MRVASDEIYRGFLFLSYLTLAMTVYVLPIPFGSLLSFVMFCWIYAYYSFEYFYLANGRYIWINRGWNFEQRIAYFESHWAYFLGFGTALNVTARTSQHHHYVFLLADC